MSRSLSTRRERLWRQNPHCFWCGIETRLVIGSRQVPDAATVDHIRSRFIPTRAQQHGRWWNGITVLSCWACNNERGSMEQAAMYALDKEKFQKRNGSVTCPESLHRAHADLASAVIGFVRRGGTMNSRNGDADHVMRQIKKVNRERTAAKQVESGDVLVNPVV